MLKILDIVISKLRRESLYIQPIEMQYTQNGERKTWDLIKVHQSVSVIIYNKSRDVLVCVKQFRPGVYLNSVPLCDRNGKIDVKKYPPNLGVSLEFCSGLVDKELTLEQIAAEEVEEECGYLVNPLNLTKVRTYRNAVGTAGDVTHLYYAEVTDDMRNGPGGGVGTELIEVVDLPVSHATKLLSGDTDDKVPGDFLFGLAWFLKIRPSILPPI